MQRVIKTQRLVLKTLDESGTGDVLDYYLRNRNFLEEWEPKRGEDFYAETFHREQLIRERQCMDEGSMLKLWICKTGEEKLIGFASFSNIVRGSFLSCFLGYKLDKDELNKGYMTEALRAGIGVMFNDYGLHRIEANIMPKNVRSLRVVEKLGFYNEGYAKKYLKINGVWEDHIHMVLLNDNL
jgi:ribosomal-protein-alanine N-acetyltransferase